MSDRKFQRQINSLIREDKRTPRIAAADRPPVPGGTGYAANSPAEISTMDKIYLVTPLHVREIGPPPMGDAEVTQVVTEDPEMAVVIGEDVFTVHLGTTKRTEIWKNGAEWKTSGFNEIIGMTGSSTELYVVDGGASSSNDPIVIVLDPSDASTNRTLASGTESWQGSGTLDVNHTPCSANDTHFVICVNAGAHIGYWLYESDFTYVDKELVTDSIRGKASLRPDKMYIVDYNSSGGNHWRLRVFDLTAALLDTQEVPATYYPYNNYEVTDRTFYFVDDSGSDKLVAAFPRETDEDTFDFTDADLVTLTGMAEKPFAETNRDMGELF